MSIRLFDDASLCVVERIVVGLKRAVFPCGVIYAHSRCYAVDSGSVCFTHLVPRVSSAREWFELTGHGVGDVDDILRYNMEGADG